MKPQPARWRYSGLHGAADRSHCWRVERCYCDADGPTPRRRHASANSPEIEAKKIPIGTPTTINT